MLTQAVKMYCNQEDRTRIMFGSQEHSTLASVKIVDKINLFKSRVFAN